MHTMRQTRKQTTTHFWIRLNPFLQARGIEKPEDLEDKIGRNRTTIGRFRYQIKNPSPGTMSKLLEIGITPAELMYAMFGQLNTEEPPKPCYLLSKVEWEQILLLRDLPPELRDQIFHLLEAIHAFKPKDSRKKK